MRILMLRALVDNYIFLLLEDAALEAVVVDPGDPGPVLKHLEHTGYGLAAILNTHHHWDHIGGNQALIDRFPEISVYGGAGDRGRIPGQTVFLQDGEEIVLRDLRARVLEVPGHTKAHVAYYFSGAGGAAGDLFSGDTVFGGTIGNLFEGTPEMIFRSIQKIRALPPMTRIWCSHEYTLQYVRESAGLDPNNARLAKRLRRLERKATSGAPTIPLILDEECATNPFFRWDDPQLAAYLGRPPGIETFLRLCEIS
jgi:hydroxyacylglutathione hydrolase